MHPEKGLDILFDAASMLVNRMQDTVIKIKVIGTTDVRNGGGGESYVRQLSDKASNVNVEWIGAIQDSVVLAKEITMGDCFVYPSVAEKGETFGVAPLEAMAFGLPVVLSDLKCFSDFAKPGVNSLQFVRGDGTVERLANVVERLIRNPDETRQLAENARKTAMLFSKAKIASEYEAFFRKQLEES